MNTHNIFGKRFLLAALAWALSSGALAGAAHAQSQCNPSSPHRLGGSWTPPGSSVVQQSDGSLYVSLPAGYVAITPDGQPDAGRMAAGFTCTCTCSNSGGNAGSCDVLWTGTNGCDCLSTCSSCTKSTSGIAVSLNGAVDFARLAETGSLPNGDLESLMSIGEVRKAFEAFQARVNPTPPPMPRVRGKELLAPRGYAFVYVKVYGFIVATLAPLTAIPDYAAPVVGSRLKAGGSAASCKCESGSEGCVRDNIGGYYGCSAGVCTKCTLTMGPGASTR